MISWAMKLHANFKVEVKVRKNKERFPYRYSVRQGDNLALILFILVMQLAVESLTIEFRKYNINLPSMRVSSSEECVIRKHKNAQVEKMDHLVLLILLHMDNRALPFCSRNDTIIGSHLCVDIISKFGLIIYTSTRKKECKTKVMFFPSTKTLKR